MTDSDRALRKGTLLHGRYRIEKVLGEGGFGITYLATDLLEQRESAVKEYMPYGITSRDRRSGNVMIKDGAEEAYERFRKKFLDEARIIYRYRQHPNIISVSHLFSDNCTAYYVMEFIEGMDLGELLKMRGRMTWEELYPIMAQVAEALREVHQGGVIHCDISPDNIFILQGGQVKLIDFGAAKSEIGKETTLIFMKKGYAPPEQYIHKGKLGPWTDIYALAVTIYQAYTGRMPPSAPERLEADRVVMPTQMGLAVPGAAWETALKKGLALRMEERFHTIEEFWTSLNERPEGGLNRRRLVLEGKQGFWAEKQIWPEGEVLFGTDRTRCQVCFPAGIPGISRVHFRIWEDEGELWIMDMGSTYGTYVEKEPLSPGLGYRLKPGMRVTVGAGQIFEAVIAETS